MAILGSLVAMLIVFAVSGSMPGGSHVLIVASAGASTVIIFTVPHSRLSQPWPVLVGQENARDAGIKPIAKGG